MTLRNRILRGWWLAAAGSALVLTGCISEEELAQVTKERDELRRALNKVESENKQAVEKMLKDLETGATQRAELEKKLLEAQSVVDQAMAEVERIRQEFETYKQTYKVSVRESAAGRQIAALETLEGRTFNGVTIREVNPAGLVIVHAAGVARVPFEQLPEAMQDEFRFEAAEAIAFIEQEKKAEADYQKQLVALQKIRKDELAAAAASGDSREGMKLAGGKHIRVWVPDDGRDDSGKGAGEDTSAPVNPEYSALLARVNAWRVEAQELREKIKVVEYRQWLANIYGKSASHTKNLKEMQARLEQLNTSIDQANAELDKIRG